MISALRPLPDTIVTSCRTAQPNPRVSSGRRSARTRRLSTVDARGSLSAPASPRHVDALRRQQPETVVGADLQGVNVEVGAGVVLRLHDRRGRGDDDEAAAFADPIDVPVAVHQDRPLAPSAPSGAGTSCR